MTDSVYPGAIDSPVDPAPTDPMNNPSHAGEHDLVNDAIVAIETALGITGLFNFLAVLGGTMSGAIAMGGNKITGLANGSASSDAAAFGQIPSVPSGSSTVTGPDSFGASSAPGSASTYSKGDHDHGLPAAPTTATTQSPGDDSTKIATTAYADAIAALKANLAAPPLTGKATADQIVWNNNAVAVSSQAATVPVTYQSTTVTNNAASSVTITIPTSGATDGQPLVVRFYDYSAAAQTITWANTENSAATAPTMSNGSTTLPLTIGFMFNSATSLWRCIAVA